MGTIRYLAFVYVGAALGFLDREKKIHSNTTTIDQHMAL